MWLQRKLLSITKKFDVLIIAVAMLCCPAISFSQNFVAVDTGFNSTVGKFTVDTSSNLLYAFGNFNQTVGSSIYYNNVAQFDGTKWDTIPVINNYYSENIIRFGGETIFGSNPILRWNGVLVDTIAEFTWGGAFGLINFNNELYAYGAFDTVNGVSASCIAKWNGGTSWSALDTTKWIPGVFILSAIEYMGDLYIGGTMINTSNTIKQLAKWDGSSFSQIDNGIVGGFSSVSCFEIYNGDLYIGGNFNVAGGNPGNSIARWDGSQWKDTGGGFPITNSAIFDLQVFNGELYAGGNYTIAGGQPISGIAKWDETNWCGLGFSSTSVNCLAVYNNELYIGGSFITINGDTMNRVSKWVGGSFTDFCGNTTEVNESEITYEALNIYPNPASNQITLEFELTETKNISIEIKNILGQTIKIITNIALSTGSNKIEIDVGEFSNGIYFVQLQNADKIASKKFIKQ